MERIIKLMFQLSFCVPPLRKFARLCWLHTSLIWSQAANTFSSTLICSTGKEGAFYSNFGNLVILLIRTVIIFADQKVKNCTFDCAAMISVLIKYAYCYLFIIVIFIWLLSISLPLALSFFFIFISTLFTCLLIPAWWTYCLGQWVFTDGILLWFGSIDWNYLMNNVN